MTLRTDSTFPSRRSYVVKLHSDAAPGALKGRLENLVTGGQRDFASGDELLESITRDLQLGRPNRPAVTFQPPGSDTTEGSP